MEYSQSIWEQSNHSPIQFEKKTNTDGEEILKLDHLQRYFLSKRRYVGIYVSRTAGQRHINESCSKSTDFNLGKSIPTILSGKLAHKMVYNFTVDRTN